MPAATRERAYELGNTAGPPLRPFRANVGPYVLVDARPFLRWLADRWPADGFTGLRDGEAITRRVYELVVGEQQHISEAVVEKVGRALAGDVHLPRELYPELRATSCAVCGADVCRHLGPRLTDAMARAADRASDQAAA